MPRRIRHCVAPVLVLAAGFVLGRLGDSPPRVFAQTRSTPEREAFQSGGARSETVLKEIAATLKTMDARLARIEAAVPKN